MQFIYFPGLVLQPTTGIFVLAGRCAHRYRTYGARPSLTQGSRPWLSNMASLPVSFAYLYSVLFDYNRDDHFVSHAFRRDPCDIPLPFVTNNHVFSDSRYTIIEVNRR
jgi:hypothetical protein